MHHGDTGGSPPPEMSGLQQSPSLAADADATSSAHQVPCGIYAKSNDTFYITTVHSLLPTMLAVLLSSKSMDRIAEWVLLTHNLHVEVEFYAPVVVQTQQAGNDGGQITQKEVIDLTGGDILLTLCTLQRRHVHLARHMNRTCRRP